MISASGIMQWTRTNAVSGNQTPAVHQGKTAENQRPFSEILKNELQEPSVTFSAHAVERMRQRNIFLQRENLLRLSGAVDMAEAKGCRDALVVDSGTAYVVSVKNRTVITLMDSSSAHDHVFTNIDGAVVL